jgi:hypothetical protein
MAGESYYTGRIDATWAGGRPFQLAFVLLTFKLTGSIKGDVKSKQFSCADLRMLVGIEP